MIPKSAISRVASMAVIVLIIVAAFGGYASSYFNQRAISTETTVETLTSVPPPETKTTTLTSTESVISTVILTNSITQTSTITQTNSITLTDTTTQTTTVSSIVVISSASSPASQGCTTSYQNGVTHGAKFVVNENSTIAICMRFFYYNHSSTATFISLNYMHIQEHNSSGFNIDAKAGQFNVSAYPPTFQIGGNSDLNEGILVMYLIQPEAGLQGTYFFQGMGALIQNGQAEIFLPDYFLVVGDGVPDLSTIGGGLIYGCTNCTHVWNGTQFACPTTLVCSMVVGSSNETKA